MSFTPNKSEWQNVLDCIESIKVCISKSEGFEKKVHECNLAHFEELKQRMINEYGLEELCDES